MTEIYKVDLVRDKILPADASSWTLETAAECAKAAGIAKAQHHRLMEAQEYKASDDVSTEDACIRRAELYLFRAKRALELSKLIPMLLQLDRGISHDPAGEDLIRKIIRIARSKTVGTEIADLTVCGAIAPYSHLAAGKLVAMLAVSPPVIAEYRRRYANVPGIIASSMAGRPIGRPANLCAIATTSLFGKRPSQYDRLNISAELMGGSAQQRIRYHHIDDKNADDSTRTKGIGSFHFSASTLKALEQFVSSRKGGWKANNLFGEGTSPKLRGLRDGLVALGLEAEQMLVHGIERSMYGVKLATNVDRYLLGMDPQPEWIFDLDCRDTTRVGAWWVERWATQRVKKDEIVSALLQETLAHPIKHRARVRLPEMDGTKSLFSGEDRGDADF
ncbi:MAG: Druantia anti-phage system protein DruA [Panacagrimonas sp.]